MLFDLIFAQHLCVSLMPEHVSNEISARFNCISAMTIGYRTHTQKRGGTAAQEDVQNSAPHDHEVMKIETFPIQITFPYRTVYEQMEQLTLCNWIKKETI